MKIVAGLGNPGREYRDTPHNAGFAVVDELARRAGCKLRSSLRFAVKMGEAIVGGQETLLVKPATFMNLSGTALAPVMRKKGIEARDLVVVLDDADLELGRLRIRERGSSGGHRGLQSVIDAVGSDDFCRVRLGIGRGGEGDLRTHVLKTLDASGREVLSDVIEAAADAVETLLSQGAAKAMNDCNARVYGRAEGERGAENPREVVSVEKI